MIDLEFVERLIRAVDDSGIDSIEIERGATRIRVSKSPPAPPRGNDAAAAAGWVQPQGAVAQPNRESGGAAPAAAAEEVRAEAGEEGDGLVEVASPMVGTFYRAPAPDAPPYVEVGDRVSKGDTLCIIEAMKLMNELESEIPGTIAEIRVENAEPVEYGQVLFRIDPA